MSTLRDDIWATALYAYNTDEYDIYLGGNLIETSNKSKGRRRDLYSRAMLHATINKSQNPGIKVLNIFRDNLQQKMQFPKGFKGLPLEQGSPICRDYPLISTIGAT